MFRLLLALGFALVHMTALATERPAYTLVRELGTGVELRDYPAMILAEIDVDAASAASANEEGFKPLAAFIFGKNTANERIGMTAPVQQQWREGGWTISFVMPARYTMDTLPRPTDPKIRLREVPARRVAAIGFSGRAGTVRFAEQQELLLRDVTQAGLVAQGPPWTAQYNPPWVPGFLRHNEVMVEVGLGD